MSRARLISFVLVFLASVTGCKSADSKEAAASSGPPCAKVLAVLDRFAAGELFPSMIAKLPDADGKPFENGNRPVRFIDIDHRSYRHEGEVAGPTDGPIYIRAASQLKAEDLRSFAVSTEGDLRLVVTRPIGMSDVLKMVEEAAPPPKSLQDWWPKVKGKTNGLGLDSIAPELAEGFERTTGRCRGAVSAAVGALAQGGWAAGAADALRVELPKCKCEEMDEPGFALVVSVLLATSNPRLFYGWLPIDRNVFYVLPPDATVDALAARLASPEPIPEPPPPPPPPPPPRLRGKGVKSSG